MTHEKYSIGLILLALLAITEAVKGQISDIDSLLKNGTVELTAAYKNCLAQFPVNAKEQLRIAERAWIVFSDKDEAAAAFVGRRRGLSEEDLDHESLDEITARSIQLRSYFVLPNEDLRACQQSWQEADNQLTAAYQSAVVTLAPDEEQKVRDAERAWIDYRDKDARAHRGDSSGRAPVWAAAVITRRRTAELEKFYGRVGSLAVAPAQAIPTATATAVPTQPSLEPAVRAKMAADFHQEVTELLAIIPAQLTGGKVDSLDQLPSLPTNVGERLHNVADDAREFRKNVGYDAALHEYKDDTAVVDALTTIEEGARQIRSGNAVHASEGVDSFHQQYPQVPGNESKVLWEKVEAVRMLCERLHDDAKTHLEKATSLSAAGKTGDALREYQKGYELFPDPTIADTIKQLREQSLGL